MIKIGDDIKQGKLFNKFRTICNAAN